MAGKAGAIRAGRAYVELYADNSQLVRGLKIAENKMRAFGNKLRSLGSTMTMAGIAGTAPFALAVKMFSDFDDAMRTVKASTNATGKQFEELTAQARELGRSSSYTATEVANAMVELGRVFGDPELVKATTPYVMDLSRATGTDFPLAASIATAAMSQFSLDASKMGMICDVLTATCNGSAAALDSIGETLEYIGPVADDLGWSFQETNKAIGALANMGIKGSSAGTALRQIALQLANPDIQKMLRRKHVEVLKRSGDLRTDFGTLMTEIGAAMANMPNAERMTLMKELFDQRATSAALKLTKGQFKDLNDTIDNATGLSRKQAKEMDAGIGGAIRELTGAIEDVAHSVGTALEPTLRKLAQYLTSCANAISLFVARNAKLITAVAAVSAGLVVLGPIISGVGMMMLAAASSCAALATAFSVLVSVAALVATPLGAVAAAMVAVTAATVTLGGGLDVLRSHFQALGSTVKEVFGIMSDASQLGKMEDAVGALTAGLRVEKARLKDIGVSFLEGLTWTSPWAYMAVGPGGKKASKKRVDAIARAENDLTQIRTKIAPLVAEQQLKKEKIGGVYPILDGALRKDKIGGTYDSELLSDIAPESDIVSSIQREARGTFSSITAGRMGAMTFGTRTERQLDKLLQKQDHANRRLDQFVDLASKAKLVFTGALPK